MVKTIGIKGAAYELGEVIGVVDELANKNELLIEFEMPNISELWGWENYRKSERSLAQLATASAEKTLQAANKSAADIDTIMICSCTPLNYQQQNDILGEVYQSLGLPFVLSLWVGGAGCASLFSAVGQAKSMIENGDAKQVLVITTDKITSEHHRFQRYGVLSDGAASFIVTADEQADFSILGDMVLSSPEALYSPQKGFQQKCTLIHAVFERFTEKYADDLSDVEAVLASNVFNPIQEIELSVMPFEDANCYEDNNLRYGHCWAADPVINLVDLCNDPVHQDDKKLLLSTTAHGHFGLVALIRN